MLKAYKYRIYPNKNQIKKIENSFNICRLIFNLGLELKNLAYSQYQTNLSNFDLNNQLPDLKKYYPWISDVDSQALQAELKLIFIAFDNYFRMLKDGTIEKRKKEYLKNCKKNNQPINYKKLNNIGKPKFKSKHGHQSFRCPNNTREVNFINNTLTIPKIKDIPIVLDRQFYGIIKTITISKTPTGKYFASILVENGKSIPNKLPINKEITIGIDLGIKSFLVDSNGLTYDNPKYLNKSTKKLIKSQKRLSRKVKKSKNYNKSKLKVALIHEKILNQRKDFLHKLSSKLISDNQTICIEDLNVSGMLKNHKLARSISDCSWSEFITMLKYKAEWNGRNIIEIGKFDPSSKTCSECGNIYKELKLEERQWICKSCGSIHDRDINAALNIKHFGLIDYNNKTRKGIPEEPVELLTLVGAKMQEVVESV